MSRGPQTALSFDTRNPNLVDVLKAARRTTELNLSVSFPATVSQVIDNGELVNVIPEFKDVVYTEVGTQTQPSRELASMPVWTYGQGSATGAYLQFPVRVGDKGMVLVSDRSLDGWYESGMANAPSHPHTHNKIDGVFIPGLRDRSRALPQASAFPDTAILESLLINLGKSASEPAVHGFILQTFLSQLLVFIAGHIHPIPSGATGPHVPGIPTTIPTIPVDLNSTKVKIE